MMIQQVIFGISIRHHIFIENPIQAFNNPGQYDITLIMNGLSGCTSSITLEEYKDL